MLHLLILCLSCSMLSSPTYACREPDKRVRGGQGIALRDDKSHSVCSIGMQNTDGHGEAELSKLANEWQDAPGSGSALEGGLRSLRRGGRRR